MGLDLKMPVYCLDDPYGGLADLVIDPRRRRLTHLVVQPTDLHDRARLVPADRLRLHYGEELLQLDSTIAEISRIKTIQQYAYKVLGEPLEEDPACDVGIQYISPQPGYDSLGPETFGGGMTSANYDQHVAVSYDRIPKGHIELRCSSSVTS